MVGSPTSAVFIHLSRGLSRSWTPPREVNGSVKVSVWGSKNDWKWPRSLDLPQWRSNISVPRSRTVVRVYGSLVLLAFTNNVPTLPLVGVVVFLFFVIMLFRVARLFVAGLASSQLFFYLGFYP